MNGIVFRAAKRDDVPAIVKLLADDALGAKRERYADPLPAVYLAAFDVMQKHGMNEVIVGVRGDAVVACLQLTVIPGLSRQGAVRAILEGVRVSADLRGQGAGEALVRFAIEKAKRAGATLVQLTTDKSRKDAHRFYERLGFKATHEGMKLEL